MAKLKDVADMAGVSITTASMALSGKGRISTDVRRRVGEAAEQVGYRKTRQTTGKVWVLILNMDKKGDHLWYFFNPIIRQIQNSAREQGFTLCLIPVSDDTDDETILHDLEEMKASAVLTIHYASRRLFNRLEEMNIPGVIINNSSFQDEFFTVCVDDFQGAYEGTVQLIKAGHRRIACLDYPREHLPSIMADRFFGFRKAIEEHGLKFPESWRVTVNLTDYAEMEQKLRKLLTGNAVKPTALFIHDDLLAARLIHALGKLDIRIPEDLSIIAPGDTLNYELPETPRISTMKIDTNLMGKYAVDMMTERLQRGEQIPHVLKIKQTFISRNSIRPLQEHR